MLNSSLEGTALPVDLVEAGGMLVILGALTGENSFETFISRSPFSGSQPVVQVLLHRLCGVTVDFRHALC